MPDPEESIVVGVRMSTARRDDLEGYVDANPEYQSVPDLLRTAVAHELSDDYGIIRSGESGTGSAGISEETITDMIVQLRNTRNELSELRDDVDGLKNEVRDGVPGDRMKAMSAIYARLPHDQSEAWDYQDVVDSFDVDEETAFRALVQLYEETGSVSQTPQNEFYRED